jgi:hypothetical protein
MNHTMRRIALTLLATASTASAVILHPFVSWDDLTQKSPDIVVARCTSTPAPKIISDGMIWSEIEVLTVLKGDTKPAPAKMCSQYRPHQGEQFLIFSTYQSDETYRAYNAAETYRIVPMDRHFQTADLTGRPLPIQIQIVLSRRLDDIRQEEERAAEEKKRLEQRLNK